MGSQYRVRVTCDSDLRLHLQQVLHELSCAEVSHPQWPEDVVHQAAIVAEEAGELVRAALQQRYERGSHRHAYTEAMQTAAMALRFMKNYREA
jgi:hypothetical protein